MTGRAGSSSDGGHEARQAVTDDSAWLVCPVCSSPLKLKTGGRHCAHCDRNYTTIDGVPCMLAETKLDKSSELTKERFSWEWQRYPGSLEEDRVVFLEETQIPAEQWRGKIALDVGCGMGRYSLVALSLGAEVVAFDLSEALFRLKDAARRESKLHLIQGDILRPPFAKGYFDIVFSQGVLHHTPSTENAFRRIAALVRSGGFLSIWVYGRPGTLGQFLRNPLRPGRGWLRPLLPLLWIVVWIRRVISDLLRVVTTRLPTRMLYALCFPLAALGAVPLIKYLTFSAHPDFRVRVHENFDWLAPPFQFKHTFDEVRGWFESEGFTDLRMLAHGVIPKIGIVGRKK